MKPWLKRTLLAVVSLVVLLGVTGKLLLWSWQREFAAELRSLEELGAALHPKDLAPPSIPDAENAAPLIAEAAKLLGFKDDERPDWDELINEKPEDPEALARFVGARGAFYGKIAVALARPRCRYPVDYGKGYLFDNPLISEMFPCVRTLRARATLALRKGDSAAAAEDLKRILRLLGTLGGEPLEISQLVRKGLYAEAFDFLATDRLALRPEEWREVAAAFEAQTFHEDFARAMEMERAKSIELYGTLLPGGSVPGPDGPVGTSVGAGWIAPKVGATAVDILTRAIDLLRRPYAESHAAVEKIQHETQPGKHWYQAQAQLLMPGFSRGFDYVARAQAMQRAAAAFCRIKADGRVPEKLEVIDPLTGKPMMYRRTEKGFELRSVGMNLKDDGGADDDIVLKSPK